MPDQSERIIVDTIRSLTFVTQHGWTALHRASAKGFVGIVRRLLHDGRCDVNARDKVRAPLVTTQSHLMIFAGLHRICRTVSRRYSAWFFLEVVTMM